MIITNLSFLQESTSFHKNITDSSQLPLIHKDHYKSYFLFFNNKINHIGILFATQKCSK